MEPVTGQAALCVDELFVVVLAVAEHLAKVPFLEVNDGHLAFALGKLMDQCSYEVGPALFPVRYVGRWTPVEGAVSEFFESLGHSSDIGQCLGD